MHFLPLALMLHFFHVWKLIVNFEYQSKKIFKKNIIFKFHNISRRHCNYINYVGENMLIKILLSPDRLFLFPNEFRRYTVSWRWFLSLPPSWIPIRGVWVLFLTRGGRGDKWHPLHCRVYKMLIDVCRVQINWYFLCFWWFRFQKW